MHVHISIWRGDENLFYDPNDEYAYLSQFARYFIGGLIEHGRALSAIVSPTVNSYKRLIPGYEAPVYLVWSKANRSAAIRIPAYSNNSLNKRIEYRPPDPSANPYLAFSAILLAGLDGIRKKRDPGDPVDENVYKMPPHKRKALGIKELPRSLEEALDELEVDNEWLSPVFPKELIETYIELKREEARKVNSYPTPVEILTYYDV
jgi:glutamine synthetase